MDTDADNDVAWIHTLSLEPKDPEPPESRGWARSLIFSTTLRGTRWRASRTSKYVAYDVNLWRSELSSCSENLTENCRFKVA